MPSRRKQPRNAAAAYFLDANVVMYAAGSDHPLREPARSALRKAVELRIPLVTDSEVLQELLHRYFSIRRPEVARSAYHSTVRLCDQVLPVSEKDTAEALELLLCTPGITARDAIHVAVMRRAGLRLLLSMDRHFDGVPEILRVDPAHFPVR